jgi:hypothetical protein
MFTDETLMPLGVQDQVHDVTRLPGEKWDDNYCVQNFKKPVKLQFFGVIAYNWKGICYIFDIETDANKVTSVAALQDYYKTEYDSRMSTYAVKIMNYLMAKAWNETTANKDGRKRVLTGRIPAKPKPGPEKNKERGID